MSEIYSLKSGEHNPRIWLFDTRQVESYIENHQLPMKIDTSWSRSRVGLVSDIDNDSKICSASCATAAATQLQVSVFRTFRT